MIRGASTREVQPEWQQRWTLLRFCVGLLALGLFMTSGELFAFESVESSSSTGALDNAPVTVSSKEPPRQDAEIAALISDLAAARAKLAEFEKAASTAPAPRTTGNTASPTTKCESAVVRVPPVDANTASTVPFEVGRHLKPTQKDYSVHMNFKNIDEMFERWLRVFHLWHPSGIFLDVGGRHGEYRHLAGNYEYKNLERDQPKTADLAAKTVVCDLLQDCPISGCVADIIFCNNVMEHLLDPGKGMRTMGSLLKRGGLLLLRTPFAWKYHANPTYGDYFRYSARALEYQCIQAGLNPVVSGYSNRILGDDPGGKIKAGNLDKQPVPFSGPARYEAFIVCYRPLPGERQVPFEEVGAKPVSEHPRFHLDFRGRLSEG